MIIGSNADISTIFRKNGSVSELFNDYPELYLKSEQCSNSRRFKICKSNFGTNSVTEIDDQSCHHEVMLTIEHNIIFLFRKLQNF